MCHVLFMLPFGAAKSFFILLFFFVCCISVGQSECWLRYTGWIDNLANLLFLLISDVSASVFMCTCACAGHLHWSGFKLKLNSRDFLATFTHPSFFSEAEANTQRFTSGCNVITHNAFSATTKKDGKQKQGNGNIWRVLALHSRAKIPASFRALVWKHGEVRGRKKQQKPLKSFFFY